MSGKKLVCFHLFNDYSGSPKVLKMVLEGMLRKGYRIDLVSSKGGVLDELTVYENLHKHSYPYRFSNNPAMTMLRYCAVQAYTFLLAFRWLFQKDVVFYINTLLPVGPALAGRLMGKRVVYHYHENAFVKGAFYKTLAFFMQKLAHEIICVSAYQASFLQRKKGVTVIPNALPKEFTDRLHPNPEAAFERKTVLMLSSLKEYKGTREFIELAEKLPQYKFVLVINDTEENINNYLTTNNGGNLTIYSRQADVTSFYNTATIVIVLTNPRQAVETFGLTALEAMSAGLPVIVPTQGGIAEMVKDGNNGYKIDVQELDAVSKHICVLLDNKELYIRMTNKALLFSAGFDSEKVVTKLTQIIKI